MRTKPRAWAYGGVIAASLGSFVINSTAACTAIQIQAVTTGMLTERINTLFEIDVRDDAGFAQAFGDGFGCILQFKGIDQTHTQ